MRIKEIRINGIRGFKYLKDHDGSASPHRIKLGGKHLFLYGENGTGKSSFCDAIEWCLTGTCEELTHRRIKNQVDFLKNKSCDDLDNPYVEIIFDHEPELLRELKSKKINNELDDDYQACIIDSGRIEKFVIDTRSTIWERFSTLLGFENLILFDEKLKLLTNEAKKIYDISKSGLDKLENEILDIKNDIKGHEHHLQQELGNTWQDLSNCSQDSLLGINGQTTNLKILASNIKKYIILFQKINEIDKSVEEAVDQLRMEKERTTAAEIHKIIEDSYQYFEKVHDLDTCPVCGNKIDLFKIRAQLKIKRESISSIYNLESKLNTIKQERLFYERDIVDVENEIKNLHKEIHSSDIIQNFSREELYEFFIQMIDVLEKEIKEAEQLLNGRIALLHERKNKLLEKEKMFIQVQTEFKLKETVFLDIQSFAQLYVTKYSNLIKNELELICRSEIDVIYNSINQSENEIVEKFLIEPDIDNKEIAFLMQMKDNHKKVDAVQVLSTGHLRCLGFALLIARIKVKAKKLGFIIIDDPIYSIDHEHRYNLIQYLKELGSNYQLLITSSDRLFYDIIRNNFDFNEIMTYETHISKLRGIAPFSIKAREKQYINEAIKYLDENDFRASSLYARLALETKFFDMTRKLKLEIPYDRINRLSINDLLEYGLEDKLKSKNPGHDLEIDAEFKKLQDHSYFRSLTDGFPLNQEVHFPEERKNAYSKPEINSAIKTIEAFIKFTNSLPIYKK